MKIKDKNPKRYNDSFKVVMKITLIFLVPALIGTLLGGFLDNVFAIKPFGSIAIMIIFYVLSWTFILKTINSFKSS